jgi:hypothetical protein
MADRTSIPMDRKVFEELKAHKGQYETWNQFGVALAELADEHHEPPTLGGVRLMGDRTSIPFDEEVAELLREQKGKYETWNQFGVALAQLADEHHDPPTLGTED